MKSESVMLGHTMAWDVSFLRHTPHSGCATWFELKARTVTAGDHSPRFDFMFCVLNFCVLEVSYFNIYHEVAEDPVLTDKAPPP